MHKIVAGISVEEVLSKAATLDPFVAPKVAVIRGLRAYEEEEANWGADQVLRKLRASHEELEVADLALPSYRVLRSVSNNPDDTYFSPDDQLPILLAALKEADCILVAVRETYGLPDANVVKLIERLADRVREKKGDEGTQLFANKPFGLVVHGGYGAYASALALAGALNKLGLTLVRHGLACWSDERGNMMKSEEFAHSLELMANDMAELVKALRK